MFYPVNYAADVFLGISVVALAYVVIAGAIYTADHVKSSFYAVRVIPIGAAVLYSALLLGTLYVTYAIFYTPF